MRMCLAAALLSLANCFPVGATSVMVWPGFQWQERQQLVTVVSASWDASTASLQRFERHEGKWLAIGDAVAVNLGRNGSAWGLGLHPPQVGLQKREGDGRAPAGVFAIGSAFGYADSATTALDYLPMQASHVCVDVPASPLYNQIVDTREVGEAAVAGNTEPMRRDLQQPGDDLYRLGFVIEHNSQAVPTAGSCIFAHVWRGQGVPTAGCTAMDAAALQAALQWLDSKRQPRFVLLPTAQYEALRAQWDLPSTQ
ncbi:MAG: L,D-transpeptidase family protein [Pseudomarimonas sp.]